MSVNLKAEFMQQYLPAYITKEVILNYLLDSSSVPKIYIKYLVEAEKKVPKQQYVYNPNMIIPVVETVISKLPEVHIGFINGYFRVRCNQFLNGRHFCENCIYGMPKEILGKIIMAENEVMIEYGCIQL